MYVTWPNNAFAGYDTQLKIVKYESWAEVSLLGGGRDNNQDQPIVNVPISVLRGILEIHDKLP